jgi:hypothetical protein
MHSLLICICFVLLSCANLVYAAEQTPEPSHGISYPVGWQNWGTIAISHRIDNNRLAMATLTLGLMVLYLARLFGKKQS